MKLNKTTFQTEGITGFACIISPLKYCLAYTICLYNMGVGQFDHLSCGFSKNVSSTVRVKPWFFWFLVTFNIITRHIFSENFI